MAGLLPGCEFESRPESLSFFPGNETKFPCIGFCLSALLVAHGGAGGETCMDVLVTIADVKLRPSKLFPRPEGLQILSLIDPFFNPFPNPFRILVLSVRQECSYLSRYIRY